jgi:hypothetical protein
VLDIERVAITVIRIDDEREADAIADQRDRLHHLVHAHEPDVWSSEPGIGDTGARDVKHFETRSLGNKRRERVVDARGH